MELTKDVNVTLSESGIEAHREALVLIQRAHVWAEGADLTWEQVEHDGVKIVTERRAKAAAMELSYFRGLVHVMTMSQGWDGPLSIWRDTEASFYWRHHPTVASRRGMEGGLVFMRDSSLSKPGEPLTIGTWEIHT